MRRCIHCEYPFDPDSFAKKQAGGKINECPDCVEELGTETAVKYLGLSAGDGKAAGISIVAFESNEDRESYSKAWTTAVICLVTPPSRASRYNAGNNHKGKA